MKHSLVVSEASPRTVSSSREDENRILHRGASKLKASICLPARTVTVIHTAPSLECLCIGSGLCLGSVLSSTAHQCWHLYSSGKFSTYCFPNTEFSASRFLIMRPRARAPPLVEEGEIHRVYFRRGKLLAGLLACFRSDSVACYCRG